MTTVDQFLERLAATPRTWELWPTVFQPRARAIRSMGEDTCDCPIEAVARAMGTAPGELPVSVLGISVIGLASPDGMAIVDAADGMPGCDRALRARLLEACGLAEPAA